MNQVVNEHSYFNLQLNTYLDGEMSQQEAEDFLAYANACPQRAEKLENEKLFRNTLKQKVTQKTAPLTLVQSIRMKVHSTASTAS